MQLNNWSLKFEGITFEDVNSCVGMFLQQLCSSWLCWNLSGGVAQWKVLDIATLKGKKGHWIVICGESWLDWTFQWWHGDWDHWFFINENFNGYWILKPCYLFGFLRGTLVCLCKIEPCSRLLGLQFGCGTTWTWLNQSFKVKFELVLNPGWAWVDPEPDPKFSSILLMSMYGGEKGLYRFLGHF